MNELLTAALEYEEKGILVVPLEKHGKHMLKDAIFHKTTIDPDKIRQWWNMMPDANVGIPTSLRRNKLIIIDVDVNGIMDGRRSLERLKEEKGIVLPETSTVQTGTGGYHLYYKNTTGKVYWGGNNVLPGIDIRSENAHIVAPPSIHPNLQKYKWIKGNIEQITAADENVIKLLMRIPKNKLYVNTE